MSLMIQRRDESPVCSCYSFYLPSSTCHRPVERCARSCCLGNSILIKQRVCNSLRGTLMTAVLPLETIFRSNNESRTSSSTSVSSTHSRKVRARVFKCHTACASLRSLARSGALTIHNFVIIPDHMGCLTGAGCTVPCTHPISCVSTGFVPATQDQCLLQRS